MGKLTRRKFFRNMALAGGALGASQLLGSSVFSVFAGTSNNTLAVVTGDPENATGKALELLGGMGKFVGKGNRVILKPNMSFPHPPERGTNTHPDVVAAVAGLCIEAGAKEVIVLDYPFFRPDPCLRMSGIRDACKKISNVHTFTLTEEKFFREVKVPKGKVLTSVKVMADVLDCDVFINIPTAKSHTTTGVSLGMKGLMGVIWDREYFHSRVDIHQAIADLTSLVKVDLTILDASRALATGGPTGPGRIETPNTIVAGTDPVAVDAMGVSLVEWYGQKLTGSRIKHITAAHNMGIGTMDLDDVTIKRAVA